VPETVSACVIVRDEQERLPACLRSLTFCDEVIVVDSGSRDATREIARAAGATVVEHPWQGFAIQRNVAMDHATGDWVLEVDADERITPELTAEIRAFLADPPAAVHLGMLPLRHEYLGLMLGPAGRYPFVRPRLIRRGSYRHDERRTVHEGVWPRERPWVARHDLHHLLATSVREAFSDVWSYAKLEQEQLTAEPTPRNVLRGAVIRPAAKFAFDTIVLGGWRDGPRGVLKLALDALGDALVWWRHLARRGIAVAGEDADHFGTQSGAQPVRVVAVASGEAAARSAEAWLREAEAAGAWSTLVTDTPLPDAGVQVRAVGHVGPLTVARALDAERQSANVTAIAAAGPRARAVLRLLPRRALAGAAPIAMDGAPAEAVRGLEQGDPASD
jgi:hypothetical protein